MTDVLLEEIFAFLRDNDYAVLIKKKDIIITANIGGCNLHLKCVFPVGFPYVFPRIYMIESEYKEISPIPHVDNNYYVCTYDSSICIPNFNNPLMLTKEVIDKAIIIVSEGIKKENSNDFVDEFNAYWRLDAYEFIESIFNPTETPKSLFCYYHEDKKMNYISDDRNALMNYLNNLGIISTYEKNFKKCFYLPLTSVMTPPFPETNYEILQYVKRYSLYYNEYKLFLQQNLGHPVIIVFSQIVNNSMSLQAWMHSLLGHSLVMKRSKTKLPGFRNNKVNPAVIFQGKEGKEKIYRLDVLNMNMDRLFDRGGDGNRALIESTVIVGCGSIGSILAETLATLSVQRLMLIDKETLNDENIARHLCGYEYIGIPKSNAVKTKLTRHNPNLECKSFNVDIFDFLRRNISSFNTYDYIFVAVGNAPTEHIFMEHFMSDKITRPIILIWVEPFMMGGHAILIQKKQDIFQLFFDDNFAFINPIVNNSEKHLKREAGCQSTYIPYSGFEVRCFINTLMGYLSNNIIAKSKSGNYLFSYIGRISNAITYNAIINEEWKNHKDNSFLVKRFD